MDKNPAHPRAITEMKSDGELWRRSWLRQVKYLRGLRAAFDYAREGGALVTWKLDRLGRTGG